MLYLRFGAFVLQNSSLGGMITNKLQYMSSGHVYYRGECSFSRSAPPEDGEYTFSVDFYPGTGVQVVKTFTIQDRNGGNLEQ